MMALYIDITNRHAFMLPYRKAVGRIKIDAPNGQPAWLASARDTKFLMCFTRRQPRGDDLYVAASLGVPAVTPVHSPIPKELSAAVRLRDKDPAPLGTLPPSAQSHRLPFQQINDHLFVRERENFISKS